MFWTFRVVVAARKAPVRVAMSGAAMTPDEIS